MLAFETISRRRVLSAGAGLLGLDLSKALAAESGGLKAGFRADSVIFVFLFGGPSQLETFDMKPDAPEKSVGHSNPFNPVPLVFAYASTCLIWRPCLIVIQFCGP